MLTLNKYRKAAVPLLAVQTADPANVLRAALRAASNGMSAPVLCWDCVHGLREANAPAQPLAQALNKGEDPAMITGNPVEMLKCLEQLPALPDTEKTIIVTYGLAEMLADPQAIPTRQALWNLRDVLPMSASLLVLAAPLGWKNPYPNDIVVDFDPLPDREQNAKTAEKLCTSAGLDRPAEDRMEKVSDALLGLSQFATEQTLALSLTPEGIDLDSLRSRKRQQIGETPGLSVYSGRERFADLGGLAQAKQLFTDLLNGKRKPGAIVFIDEIEKATAGTAGDTSGTSQDQHGCLLSYMQDNEATGSIFVGPPGAAKSALAKAIGNEGDIPTVMLDMGALKGSLVGESEARIRAALQVITAISGGKPLFIATCNSLSGLSTELQRRFTLGTFFFDLPTDAERAAIWTIYKAKYQLAEQPLPKCDNWTGAEIKQCADLSDRLGITLVQAARYVVPVAVKARERVDQLRKDAHNRFLSASSDGLYQYPTTTTTTRKIQLDAA